ncbi:MAG TPA: hypothetical protein DHW42_08485, partial [Candidatus Marinimicrobia bacterium]|nr:hypothetical protein [Candidatus Neomarinimicrobiota bacterium]
YFRTRHIELIKTVLNGTIGPPNGYGAFIGLGLYCYICLCLENKIKISKPFKIIILIIFISSLVLNKSRGAWISLFLSLIILMILLYRNNIKRFLCNNNIKVYYAYILLICVCLVIIVLVVRINISSSIGRIYIWKISINLFFENIFTGVGYGCFDNVFLDYQAKYLQNPINFHLISKASNIASPHNQFLYIFCEAGIIGGIIFLLLYILSIVKLIYYINKKDINMRVYLYLFCFIIITIIHSMIDSILLVVPIKLILFCGFSLVPFKIIKKDIKKKMVGIVYILLFIINIFYTKFIYAIIIQYPGYEMWTKGNIELNAGNFYNAIEYYDKALNIIPNNPIIYAKKGMALVGSGLYKDGIEYLENIKDKYNYRDVYLSLSLGYLRLGNFTLAEKYAKHAHNMFPDQLRPYLLLSEIYYNQAKFDEARECLNRCVLQITSIRSKATESISECCSILMAKMFDEKINIYQFDVGNDITLKDKINSIIISHKYE